MSSSRVILPVLDLEQEKKPLQKRVLKGCKQFQTQKITPQSSSSSSTTWTFQPPSQSTVLDRRIDLEWTVELENNANFVPGNGGTGNYLYLTKKHNNTSGNVDYQQLEFSGEANRTSADVLNSDSQNNLAPRQFPLANCMNSIDLSINGTHFSSSVSDYVQAVMRYTSAEYRERVLSSTAHMPDLSEYSGANKEHLAVPHNPISLDTQYRGEVSRGALMRTSTGSGTPKLSVSLREPLFLSPLLQHFGEGMTNINEISVTVNWKSNPLAFLWCLISDGNAPYTYN